MQSVSSHNSGPTFGGVLYDAVTFRWAIFLIVIGEMLSLISLVCYLVYEICLRDKPEFTRYKRNIAPHTGYRGCLLCMVPLYKDMPRMPVLV